MTAPLLAALLLAPAADGTAGPAAADARADPQTYLLRYKFAPDTSLRYEIDTAGVTDSKTKGNDQRVVQSGGTVQRLDVLEAPAAGNAPGAAHDAPCALIRVTSESIRLSARFDDAEKQSYDSDAGLAAPAQFSQVAELVGEPMCDLTLTAGGEVVAAATRLPGRPVKTVDAAAYRDLFPRLPVGPVAVGEKWDDTVTVKVKTGSIPTPWKLRRRFVLEKVEGDVATIAVKVTPLPPPADVKVRQQLAGRCPAGTVTFGIAAGTLLTQKASVDEQIINFQGPGTMLRLSTDHDQRLLKVGPTASLLADSPAGGRDPAVRAAKAGGTGLK